MKTLCVAVVMLTALPAFAQPGGGRGRGPGGPGGGFGGRGGFGGGGSSVLPLSMLLRIEQVRNELEIMPDQQEALTKMAEQARANQPERPDFNSIREMSEEDRRAFFDKMRKEAEGRLGEANEMLEQVLLPPQLDRLREIAIQQAGMGALASSYVIEALEITEKQLEEMKTARDEAGQKMRAKMEEMFAGFRGRGGQDGGRGRGGEGGRGGRGGEGGQGGESGERGDRPQFDRDAMREQMESLRKEIEDSIMSVLSSEQRNKFEELKGDEFEMPQRGFGRGGQGGQGGRGFGGPGGGRGGRGGEGGGARGGRGGRPESE